MDPAPGIDEERLKRMKMKAGKISTEIQILQIGGLLIVSTPGELTVEISSMIKRQSPYDFTMTFGYTNDSVGYLPADELVPQGGHEVTHAASHNVQKPILAAMKRGLEALQPVTPSP